MKRAFLLSACLAVSACTAELPAQQNQPPQITNFKAQYEQSGNLMIRYDLADAEDAQIKVSLRISNDFGVNFVTPAVATGDLGFPVAPGTGKTIVLPLIVTPGSAGDYRVQLIADDMQPVDIQAIVNEVDSMRLKADLKNVIEGVRNYEYNPVRWEATKDTIAARFKNYGLETRSQSVPYDNITGHNIIGRSVGTESETATWIINAHFDSEAQAPGADDNGSGVVGMLEAARILSKYSFKNSVRFIGFDLEEDGLIGSEYYVNNGIEKDETIRGVYNLEMIGYYSEVPNSQELPPGFEFIFAEQYQKVANNDFKGDFIANIANTQSDFLKNAYDSAALAYVPGFKTISIALPGNGSIAPDFRRSDHAPFWDANIPAVMLNDGGEFRNKNYHTESDVSDSLNFTFMANTVKATIGAVANLAGITHATTAVTTIETGTSVENKNARKLPMFSIHSSKGALKLRINNPENENLEMTITDISGKIIYKTSFKTTGSFGFTHDISNYPAGAYFVTFSNGKVRLEQQKFIRE
jgi:hypothetical protein